MDKIHAIKVHQWLKDWEKVDFDPLNHRSKPEGHFYIFSLSAAKLKSLTGIHRRTASEGSLRSQDLGIQRRHDPKRSRDIRDFVSYGHPLSDLSDTQRKLSQFESFRKPGWLPTAIVVNILKDGDERLGKKVAKEDLLQIENKENNLVEIALPQNFKGSSWIPKVEHPIEVIDGQHRLWAFEEQSIDEDFELPVVAFWGLDLSWQAYLFWTINIKPKRINSSLAYDLYPLLRTEDWLEKIDGHPIYKETRAQELTEALWSNKKSPWYQTINMLGESGLGEAMVTQSAWIRSLISTYLKPWTQIGKGIGGLFGAQIKQNEDILPWSRAQQAAFLIFMGDALRNEVQKSKASWAESLRAEKQPSLFQDKKSDLAFYGTHTLLATDQGIRGLLSVTNDLCYISAEKLKLFDWVNDLDNEATDEESVQESLETLQGTLAEKFLIELAKALSSYDWRTAAADNLSEDEKTAKLVFRGSGGYRQLRQELLSHIVNAGGDVAISAKEVMKRYE